MVGRNKLKSRVRQLKTRGRKQYLATKVKPDNISWSDYYRKDQRDRHDRTLKHRLSSGLLEEAREVEAETETGSSKFIRAYTISGAARALGRGRATINRWIANGMLLAPRLHRKGNKIRVLYSEGEINAIYEVLCSLEIDLDNLHCKSVQNKLSDAQKEYRGHNEY